MIKTTAMLLQELQSYRNPRDKLARMVQNKECIPIIQGLYETDSSTPGYRLANCICTPSYLSFEFALSYHGLIPEAVYNFTSATFEKKRKKFIKLLLVYLPIGMFHLLYILMVLLVSQSRGTQFRLQARKRRCVTNSTSNHL